MDKSEKVPSLHRQVEQMLQNAIIVTEMAIEMREQSLKGEKYSCYLRSLAWRAGRVIIAMHQSARAFLALAQKLTTSGLKSIETEGQPDLFNNLKGDLERLQAILDKELLEMAEADPSEFLLLKESQTDRSIGEKLHRLESKQKMENIPLSTGSPSTRSFKQDVDEKYPENWSRENLFDMANLTNLPPLPEDIFSSCTRRNKPQRTLSLSSLKSIRKVNLCLRRAAISSDDSEESETEERELQPDETGSTSGGDHETKASSLHKKSGLLGNIKEETPQDQ